MPEFAIEWTHLAKLEFQEVGATFRDQTPKTARKVRKEIFDAITKLSIHPHRYPPDPFRVGNQGDFRAFEKHNYRIRYQIRKSTILILRIRHNKQMPLDY